ASILSSAATKECWRSARSGGSRECGSRRGGGRGWRRRSSGWRGSREPRRSSSPPRPLQGPLHEQVLVGASLLPRRGVALHVAAAGLHLPGLHVVPQLQVE